MNLGSGPSSSSDASSSTNNFWQYLESTWTDEQPNSELDTYLKESTFQF